MQKRNSHYTHQGPGAVTKWEHIESGLRLQAENAQAKVQVYDPGVIRVQITNDSSFDNLSYAVVANPIQDGFEVTESTHEITLATELVRLVITTDELSFALYDTQGNLINKDEEGFGISFLGNDKTVYKSLQPEERFVGLGETTGNLDRRGNGYTNWNTDAFAYGPGTDPIYGTHPFYIGIHGGVAYGIFLDNTYKSHFNFGASNHRFSSFTVEGGELDYYLIYQPTVAGIIEAYTHLTGRMEMPPIWSLGYQQCRYSYYPEEEVYAVARTFREKKIPADAIVLDIHYMDQYKIWSWDKQRFPDPLRMMNDLKEQGYEIVVMCDPGIKVEEGYEPYQDGLEQDVFVKYPDGSNYQGQVWPGWCHFPDFTNAKAREWWGAKMKEYVDMGVKGYWNDMNEIATWGQRLPELMEFSFEGQQGSTKRARNVYGMLMCQATYEGTKSLLNGERPFNLTRASYSGVQRYSAVWTGDNVANDEHMLLGVRLVNSLGLTGVAFTGYDVGGFVGNTGTGLFARWVSIGAFSPFFRGHTMVNSSDSEPWSFGEEVEDISRNYINLRYQLLPYIYSAFYEAVQSGLPVARSLAIDYTFEDSIYDGRFQNQYLFGSAFLVAPVESYKDIAKVYLPKGNWYNFHSDLQYEGTQEVFVDCPLTHLPIFVKAGSIVPMQSIVQSTKEQPQDILNLHVYQGPKGSFDYYEDDGKSFEYQSGKYHKRTVVLDQNQLSFSEVQGELESKFKRVKLFLHGFEDVSKLEANGADLDLDKESFEFLPAVSNFDPVDTYGSSIAVSVQTAVFGLVDQELVVSIK